MKNIRTARLKKELYPRFKDYIREIFHSKHILLDERYLGWQYDGFYIVQSGENIIGHFGFKDLSYKVYDSTRIVRTLMNLYVLEPYRIFGIGALLAKQVFDTSYDVFTSGYTEATEKLGTHLRPSWRDAGNLRRFLAIFDDKVPLLSHYGRHAEFCNLKTKIPKKGKHANLFFSNILPETSVLNAFWRKIRTRYPVTVERTSAYLKWRFIKHPILRYSFLVAWEDRSLKGYLVYRHEKDQGFDIARIIDFVADESVETSLLVAFIDKTRKEGAHVADFFFSGKIYNPALRQAGFFNVARTTFARFPVLFNPIAHGRTSINIAYDINTSFTDCYFTKADGDQDRPNPH